MNGFEKKLCDILAHLATVVSTVSNSVLLKTFHVLMDTPHLLTVSK